MVPYIAVADLLTQTFGADCEVVLHDLDVPEHSVVYVSNNTVTGRQLGESFEQLVRQVLLSDALQENVGANYYFTAQNGKRIRSSTLLIKNEAGHLEGALCINLDTTRITRQIEFLESFLPPPAQPDGPAGPQEGAEEQEGINQSGHIADMVENLIDKIIDAAPAYEMTREERVEKVRFMEAKGIFLMKGSVDRVAEKLGINKVTVYSYLDEVRGKRSEAK